MMCSERKRTLKSRLKCLKSLNHVVPTTTEATLFRKEFFFNKTFPSLTSFRNPFL